MHTLRTLHLFAGAGGGILGDVLLGHQCVCAVEIDPYCQQVLSARQKDGRLPWFPIFADVTEFNGHPWRGKVDVVSGGFPCTDISAAGKGAGIGGKQSGLWSEMARIIGEVRPRYAFVENSPLLISRGLDRVLGDLSAMGYDARWGIVGAHHAGAPHKRDRIWIVADADGVNRQRACESAAGDEWHEVGGGGVGEEVANAISPRLEGHAGHEPDRDQSGWVNAQAGGPVGEASLCDWWATDPAEAPEPGLGGVSDGLADWFYIPRTVAGCPNRTARLRALGNGQVPAVVQLAWEMLSEMRKISAPMPAPSIIPP